MKLFLILASTKEHGIGFNNQIPWHNKTDLKYFSKLTRTGNNAVIFGKNTYLGIKTLKDRDIFVLTKDETIPNSFNSLDEILKRCSEYDNVWIAGGAQLYDEVLKNYSSLIDGIFHNVILEDVTCDTFVKQKINVLTPYIENVKQDNIIFNIYLKKPLSNNLLNVINEFIPIPKNQLDIDYLNLIKSVLEEGELRTSRNAKTISKFSHKLDVDLSQGFPLLTTKKVFFKGVLEELLWFIKGNTNSKDLEEKGVNIWKLNTTREFLDSLNLDYQEGMGGPIYGWQWRRFGQKYQDKDGINQGFDQLQFIIDEIKRNPSSRRLFMSAWNPNQLKDMCLPPCHVSYQFYVNNNKLSCQMYQRSADIFLGLPFNIASTALLTYMIAHITNLDVGKIHLCLGDAHVYEEHLEAIKKQIVRESLPLPKLKIVNERKNIEDFQYEDFQIENYLSHPIIKAPMIA